MDEAREEMREGHRKRNVHLVLVATIFTHRLCSLVTVHSVSKKLWAKNID